MKTQYILKNDFATYYFSDKEMTEFHREDGPAVEYTNGDKCWYLNGKHHREDGPAIEYTNGTKFWFLNGDLHREDGPAVEYASGSKLWYRNGEYHREDGPAIEGANGEKMWYRNGRELTEAEFLKRTTKLELTLDEIATKFGVDPKNLKIKK